MDMAHELGHLVMHSGATTDDQEKEAEHFAGCFLMPPVRSEGIISRFPTVLIGASISI
jgi:hypothetical protein